MNKTPLVTVLMPCFNAMPFLPEALESIIHQTYSNLEILCINDGSTDNTGDVLEDYAKKDARIKVVHNETNLKLIRSLNKGIELAQGEYIARMDADDITDLRRIEIQINYFLENPDTDILSTGSYNFSEEGFVFSRKTPRAHYPETVFFASFFYVPIGHPELLIRTNVLRDNPFLYEDYALHTEDYELWSRLARLGYKLKNIDSPLHFFRNNSQSVSRKYTTIQDENFIICANRHHFEYTNFEYPIEITLILANRINKSVTLKQFKTALNEYKKFKSYFIERESINDETVLKEIDIIYFTHLFDISFQIVKTCRPKLKCYGIWMIIKHSKMFFYRRAINYFFNKIHFLNKKRVSTFKTVYK